MLVYKAVILTIVCLLAEVTTDAGFIVALEATPFHEDELNFNATRLSKIIHASNGLNSSNNYSTAFVQSLRNITTNEGQLYKELMINYERDTRPVMNASDIVNISLTFTFSQVLDLDEKSQALSVMLWMDHIWRDEKLIWNPEEFHNITEIKIPSTDVWKPDIVLYNTAEDKVTQGKKHQSRVYVKNTGEIFWAPIMKFISSCRIDITYFPFDDQICHLKLGSWAYDGFQVDIWNQQPNMSLAHAKNNSEFLLVNSMINRTVEQYPCCPEPYIDIKVFLHIRRQTILHVFNIIIPCVVLSIISMVGFLIPPTKNDEKISVQLTVLFSLSLYMLSVADSTPHTSEAVPLLGVYLTALMSLTAMSTTAHVVCDKILSSSTIRNEFPYLWSKARYKLEACCQKTVKSIHKSNEMSNSSSIDQQMKKDNLENFEVLSKNEGMTQFGENIITLEQEMSLKGLNEDLSTGKSQNLLCDIKENGDINSNIKRLETIAEYGSVQEMTPRLQKKTPTIHKLTKQSSKRSKSLAAVHPDLASEKGLETLFHQLKLRQDKVRSDLTEESDWYLVAAKIDKVFFLSYCFSVTLLTLYAFWFKPMEKSLEV